MLTKSGALLNISATMVPTDHMSAASLYSNLNSSSGARYRLVATYFVSPLVLSIPSRLTLDNPKSHIFRSQLLFTSKFFGFFRIRKNQIFYDVSVENARTMQIFQASENLVGE